MHIPRSHALYQEALTAIVGGVNSPSRSFRAVGGKAPLFIKKAKGAYFFDEDGHRYIDYLAAFGPIILGHAHPAITKAIVEAAENGILYGAPTEKEIRFAQMLTDTIPSMEQIRFVNSGTEAVMTTIRLARAYTGRSKILKFEGCYHGHCDLVLVSAGSGPATLGLSNSAGIPMSTSHEVITIPFNDIQTLEKIIHQYADQIAGILVEPIVGNFGIVTPVDGFLQRISQLADQIGALVIYDEVITAFRFRLGGVQTIFGIQPDLTALGKIIGGGLPIGAYGGKKHIMEKVSPMGPVYQAGTMAGNPLSISSGMACLQELKRPGTYESLDRFGKWLENGIRQLALKYHIPVTINRYGGALTLYFTDHPVVQYTDAKQADDKQFAIFFHLMLEEGVYLAPSKYEAWFLTTAHGEEEIQKTLQAVEKAFQKMQNR